MYKKLKTQGKKSQHRQRAACEGQDHVGMVEESNKAHNFHVTPTYCISLLVHHGGQVFDDLVHIQHVTLKRQKSEH